VHPGYPRYTKNNLPLDPPWAIGNGSQMLVSFRAATLQLDAFASLCPIHGTGNPTSTMDVGVFVRCLYSTHKLTMFPFKSVLVEPDMNVLTIQEHPYVEIIVSS